MKWEYKWIVKNNDDLFAREIRSIRNPRIEPPKEDFEKTLNELGQAGWELVSSTVIDGYQYAHNYKEHCVIEYIFKRPIK